MKPFYATALMLMLILTACSEPDSNAAMEPTDSAVRPLIVASNFPLSYFARRIAGDAAEVVFPQIEGDPALWKPDAEQIALLQSADLVLLNGAGYESWLDWVSLRKDSLLDTSADFHDRLIPLQQETVHQHGPSGEHSHAGMAFTVWLDPDLAALQATAVERGIRALLPDLAEQFKERLSELLVELEQVDSQLKRDFSRRAGQATAFSHPVYQYLEQKYGLAGFSMHWEPAIEPGVRDWVDFRDLMNQQPADVMLWEGQPLDETTKNLESLGVKSVVFDPLGNPAPGSDYFQLMKANARRLP